MTPPADGGISPITTPDAGSGASSSGDAGSSTVDSGGPADSGSSDGCVAGDAFDVESDGPAPVVAAGLVTLTMTKDKRVALTHTFNAPKPFTRSKLELLLDVDWQNSWGSGSGDYIPFVHQYFGPNDQTDSYNDVVFAQNTMEARIHPGTGTTGLGGISVPKAKQVTVTFETTWSEFSGRGTLKVTAPDKAWSLMLPTTTAGATASALYVELGGTAKGNIPDLTLGLRRACVTFGP